MLGLSQEEFARVDGFAQDNGITFPMLMHNSSINPYGVPLDGNFAVEVIVDRQGKVAYAGQSSTAESLLPIIQQQL